MESAPPQDRSSTSTGKDGSILVEQSPWIGKLYREEGIGGQKLAIVSQWRHRGPAAANTENFTVQYLQRWLEVRPMNSFFGYIPNYFPPHLRDEFWQRVIFLNLLPNCINVLGDKLSVNDHSARTTAIARLSRIVEGNKPDKILFFSNSPGKGWDILREKIKNRRRLGAQHPTKFEMGEYSSTTHMAQAFGLRYPMGAPREVMSRAISHILSF